MITVLLTRPTSQESAQLYLKHGVKIIPYNFKKRKKEGKIRAFIAAFGAMQPNVFRFLKDTWVNPRLLKLLKGASPKTKFIMWYGDQRGKVPDIISERSKFIDMLFVNNADPQQVKMYNKIGIPYVKPFYSNYYPTKYAKVKPTVDVIFGGNNFNPKKFPLSKFRLDTVLAINKICKMKIYGNGWPVSAAKYIASRVAYNQALHTAKITLGINHYNVARYYDRRLFDCLSTGRMHLTHYIPGMEKDFENHKNLVWFKTIPEGVKLIKYYLNNNSKRNAIGKAGLATLLLKHSMDARIKTFVKHVSVML